jgi:alkaline phosphatase D
VTVFRHGVASGDPDTERVVIWTRPASLDGQAVDLGWMLATDSDLREVVASGSATATAETDHTVAVDVGGLEPGRTYWYAFESGGQRSPVGRTRTLPGPDVEHLRFAAVSCAKFNSGFFNGYARIAEREDLDFVLHLGDYIYEASQTPPASQTPGADIGRPFDPLHECKTLADYRLRYAQYRSDPDTQALHHVHPMLATLDDHELADGAWRDGADEHRPERDGPWSERRAAAFRARTEWIPQRLPDPAEPERVFRTVGIGALLFESLARSTPSWRLLANSSVLSHTWARGISDELHQGLRSLKLIAADGGPDPDQWDGYPHERAALLDLLEGRDSIVLSGDVHVAMAIELRHSAKPNDPPLAAEFVTASLTSQNLDDKKGWGYRKGSLAVERELLEVLPSILWCDMDSHGYMVIDVTPERVVVEHWFVDGVLARTTTERLAASWVVKRGSSEISRAD